ncbi:hypothetical protein M9458_026636, partial [Cirrhinus mrigala]
FKRFVHPSRIRVPTLLDFADWLEYELQVQDDTVKTVTCAPYSSTKRREGRYDFNILMGTQKPFIDSEPRVSAPESRPSSNRLKGKVCAYCPYCDNGSHFLNGCLNFRELTKDQKETWIRKNNRCWRCGRNHHASRCTVKALCKTCNRKHLLVLHDLNERVVITSSETEPKENSCLVSTTKDVLYVDRSLSSRRVLLKVSKVIITNGDASMETYAMLDDGSERTILLHAAAQQLNLKGKPEDLILRTVKQDQQVLHGVAVSFTVAPVSHPHKKFLIRGAFTAERLGLAEHTYLVTSLQKKYQHLAGLPLQQMDRVQPVLLIGSDCPYLITPIEPVLLGPPGGPAAVKTHLGWTLQGPTQEIKHGLNVHQCFFTSVLPNSDLFAHVERLWQMDVVPYHSEKVLTRSKLDQEAIQLLQEKATRVEVDGIMCYATPPLRVKNVPNLTMPKEAVLPQLRSVERKLLKNTDQASTYQAEITKLKDAGYAVKLEPSEVEDSKESWYIPHHMVQHNRSHIKPITAGRVTPLPSDIKSMFHQVRLLPDDMPLLRFLWRDLKPEQLPDVYQWQVLPFGTTCSPCCATYALQRHVVDHSLPGDQLCSRLASGGFELRQWASNCPSAIAHLPPESRSDACQQDVCESTLGLHWQSARLTFFATNIEVNAAPPQYDPLGYIIPYTTRAKILVQRLWDKRCDWDDPQLPEDLLTLWCEWEKELSALEDISLPRCYFSSQMDHPSCRHEIHIFCDASEQAYGAVAYLCSVNNEGQVEVTFMAARSRVAHRKQQSIARLELCTALSGAQLSKLLVTELTIPIHSVILWSDSTTVLTWLKSSSCRYKVFEGTRVAEIQELTASAS